MLSLSFFWERVLIMRKTILLAVTVCVAGSVLMSGCSKLRPLGNKLMFWKKGDTNYVNNDAAFRNKTGRPEAALKTVYFAYDSSDLASRAASDLDGNAAWIQQNAASVQIEGHCDSRGTADYNYALGMKRAEGVRSYVVGRGVNPEAVRAISYGADKPVVGGEDERAYSQNRRAEFMVFDR